MIGARVKAVAYHLGERRETNEQLIQEFGTWTPEKIYNKTGVKSRPLTDSKVSDFATKAAQKLFEEHPDITPDSIDMLVLCTECPDYVLPATACIVHHNLGLRHNCGAFDYSLGCSGYTYGLAICKGFIAAGLAKRVMLLTADLVTRYINKGDKSTRPIFGDGATATVLDASDVDCLAHIDLGTDGSGYEHIIIPASGFAMPKTEETAREEANRFGNVTSLENLHMNGREVIAFAEQRLPGAMDSLMSKAGVTWDDIDLVVFHQASLLMLEHLRKLLGVPEEKYVIDLEDCANTAASTIPIALARAEKSGRLKRGMKVLVSGFGVGLSWSSAIIDW